MIRVLHLLPQTPDFETERGAATLAGNVGANFPIVRRSIGPGGDYRNSLFASFQVRGIVRDVVDVVHTWGESARIAAISAGAMRVVFSPVEFATPKHLSRLTHLPSRCQVHIACPSQSLRDVYLAAGIPAGQIALIRPGVDMTAIRPTRDAALRNALGFADGDFVLLAPGESTRASGHYDAVWAASILHVLDPTFKALLWGRGGQTLSCVRLAEKFRQPSLLTVAQWKLNRRVEFEELLSAADAAVFAPTAPTPTLPLMHCITAGMTILATPSSLTEEMLKNYKNAVVVERHAPRLLAQSLLELRQGGRLQAALSDPDRNRVARAFSSRRFVEEFRRLYRRSAR